MNLADLKDLACSAASRNRSATGEQDPQQPNHCNHEQYVDEASAKGKSKAQQAQDYQNRENCPKRVAPTPLTSATQQRLAGNSGHIFCSLG